MIEDSDDSMSEDEQIEVKLEIKQEVEEVKLEERPKVIQQEEMDADELGVDKAATKVWLVKIPKFVSEKWSKISEPGVELGKLRIYKKQVKDHLRRDQGVAQVKLILADNLDIDDDDSPPVPKNYNLTITNLAPKNEYVFTENSQGKAVEVAGTVHHEATVGPVIDDDYRRIMKLRTKISEEASSSRTVRMLSDKSSKKGLLATSGNQWDATKTAKKVVVDKRERLSKDDLLNLIFTLFQESQFYTLKELVDRTQQPQIWLKENLSEVCDFHRKGQNVQNVSILPEKSCTRKGMQIKYKGPAPDGSRASLIGDPKEVMGMIPLPLSTRLKLIKQHGFDLFAARISLPKDRIAGNPQKDIENAPWMAKNALEIHKTQAVEHDVSSEDFLEFLGTFQSEVQSLIPQDADFPIIEPTPHPDFSFIKVKKSLSYDVVDTFVSSKSSDAVSPSRKRPRTDSQVDDNSVKEKGSTKGIMDSPLKMEHSKTSISNSSLTKKDDSSKKSFPLTLNNGKNVAANTWAEIGTKLKHKADDYRKDKEKRVHSYPSTIYYIASLFSFWTWCNHHEHTKNYEKVKAMAKYALESVIHHNLEKLHSLLNYCEAHILTKVINGLHKELQTVLAIISSLAKDVDKHDKDQVTSLHDTASKASKLQKDIWTKTLLQTSLLKEAFKVHPVTVNPFNEYATSTDAFAFIRHFLIDFAKTEDIEISFEAPPPKQKSNF